MFEVFEYYAAGGIPLLTIGLCEVIAVSYIYGIDRLWIQFEEMLGFKPHLYMKILIKYLSPIAMLIILGSSIIDWTPVAYVNYKFPWWSHALGWCLSMSSIICLPVYAIYLVQSTPEDPKGLWHVSLKM